MPDELRHQEANWKSSAAPILWTVLLLGTVFLFLQTSIDFGQMEVQLLTLLLGFGGLGGFWFHRQQNWVETSWIARGFALVITLLPATLTNWGLLASHSFSAAICSQVLLTSLLLLLLPNPSLASNHASVENVPTSLAIPTREEKQSPCAVPAVPLRLMTQPAPVESETELVMRFQRTRNAQGDQLVEGVVSIEFARGETLSSVHLTFSPPLPGSPEIQLSEPDTAIRIKVGAVYPFGARLEARRRGGDLSEQTLLLPFKVTCRVTKAA